MNAHPQPDFELHALICEPYKLLFLDDFSPKQLETVLTGADKSAINTSNNDAIYDLFHQGLINNKLMLRGRFDDLGGIFLVYINTYVDVQKPDWPFREEDWKAFTPEQQQQISDNAKRLAPLIK